ncbi:hypothetical protein GCM10012320_26480 [Sinomonas cellulolyticus]|uniref:Uncharacterized protein n=1 Tax=Sinomonas cellulolyticus TaxID=2801916 RepID=A0ABS1K634_9MICC|nr:MULTISPECIES: hypothetical protein [Sinomonas]MBL0707130.1 hypothetical protein [Sinomonas cellulolyticus]GHG54880.1 hypothetical protein GCM10012320_26480 [Sinomonas sp. KCTC 49339]
MLRFDHMPSDYNPMFLFLGNREDLQGLAAVLRGFEQNPAPVSVRHELPDAGGHSQLTIIPGEGNDAPYGLRPATGDNQFTWMLNAWQAGQIAARVEALTPKELKAGNDIIELGLEGEIPVKVSRGEFTDNFLTPRHHLDPDYKPEAAN